MNRDIMTVLPEQKVYTTTTLGIPPPPDMET
jgi:hypothetical protein